MGIFGGDVDNSVFVPELAPQGGQDGQGAAATPDATNNTPSPDTKGQEGISQSGNTVTTQEGHQDDTGEATPPQESGQGEKLLAGKFKTVEELEQAYNNIVPKFTQKSQQLSDVTKELIGLRKQGTKTETDAGVKDATAVLDKHYAENNAPKAPVGNSNYEYIRKQYPNVVGAIEETIKSQLYNDYIAPMIEKQKLIEQQNAARNEIDVARDIELTIAELAAKDSEFPDVAPKMKEMLQKHNLDVTSDNILLVYNAAKSQVAADKAKQRISQARNEAYAAKEIKTLVADGRTIVKQGAQEKSAEQSIIDDMMSLKTGKLFGQ
jgi:hypothetical protein